MTAHTYKLDQRGIPYRVSSFRICGAENRPEPAGLQAGSPQPAAEILRHSGKQQAFRLYVFGI